jgi:hypothetical protein
MILFDLQCMVKYFFESNGTAEGNALARQLNGHVRGGLMQNKWYRFDDIMVSVSKEGDLVLTYNVSTMEEAEAFKGNFLLNCFIFYLYNGTFQCFFFFVLENSNSYQPSRRDWEAVWAHEDDDAQRRRGALRH